MPAYYYDGGSWRTLNTAYYYDGSSWRTINSGWYYNGSSWSQIFTTGTFTPVLRIPGNTTQANSRSVGLAIELYKGSTATGTYTYQFQYALGGTASWTNESIAGSSGTITGATQTASFTTDSSYVTALETLAYSGNNTGILDDVDTYRLQTAKQAYIRARVIKSGETQFTNNVRIQKRQPVDTGTLLRLRRASTGTVYTITGNPATDKQPFVGDTIYWEPSFQATTTLTNDTRPDYYWFNFDSNSGSYTRNSILSDPTNPRNPVNGRSYTVVSSDLNGPIVCNLRAINTNGAGTRDITVATRDVSDGTLTAPINLVLQYSALSLTGTWDAAGGGNDTTITYTWYLERSIGGGAYTQVASGNTTTLTFSNSQTVAGNYRFYVVAAQTGSPNVTSGYSNVYTLAAPAAFNVTIQNVTTSETYRPSIFSVNAPTLSSTILNRWTWTWGTSTITGPAYAKTGSFNVTTMNNWTSQLTRPSGAISSFTVTSPTDFWTVDASGNHTETVTANNNRKNYIRISWTKPAATSAVSYRVFINAYSAATNGSIDWTRTINVEDVNFVDIEHDYAANGSWATGQTVLVSSVTAYNGPGQTGVSTSGTIPPFNEFGADGTTSWSACNVIGTRQASRTDNLTLESPTTGFIYITGTFEPGYAVTMTGTSPTTGNTGWSPSFDDPGWTHTYKWYRSGTVTFQQISGATSKSFSIPLASTYIGDVLDASVVSSYKGQSFTERFDSTTDANSTVKPSPPTFVLSDNGNRTVSISSVNSIGATFYYGTYGGVGTGLSIPETAIATTSTSAQVTAGTLTASLYARRYVNLVYPTTQTVQVNSNTATTNTVTVNPSPQDTSSRRYLSNAPSIGAGNTFYVSTNGYFGNALMANNNYFSTIPTTGGFLNIAAQDLVMQYCYSKVDNGGTWIRYRGNRYLEASKILEYQAYLTFSGTVYVLFIENSLTDYVANTAYTLNGSIQNTWLSSSTDSSNFTVNQGTTGWTSRSVTSGSNDDGVVSFTVIRPARQHQAGAVTRTGGGFTFQITNVDDSTFESAATYGVSTTAGTATINTSTGLVTQTGLTSNQFATVTVSKARTGYETATNVVVQGQALQGAAPSQTVAPSISASGTQDTSGTIRRIQSGGSVTGSAGTYDNQQSISSGLLTILSNAYTGSNSDWTSAGTISIPVSIGDTAARSSANMYRWRDRVTGTDGSVVDFYSSIIYRAVYTPPPGVGLSSTTSTSITLSYTGYGAQRIYRYRDGSQIDSFVPPASGPAVTQFTGLTASTSYTLLLYGGNDEGYLSVNGSGGTFSTSSGVIIPSGGVVTLSGGNTPGSVITATTSGWANSPTSYDVYITTSTSATPVSGDSRVAQSNGGTSASYTITSTDAVAPANRFRAFATASNAAGTSSPPVASSTVIIATPPAATPPAITSGPSISWSSGNNFTLAATASDATNIEFEVQFANANGGPVLSTQTFFMGASAGSRTTGAQSFSWARTRARANNTTTGLSSSFTGYTAWA